ncbi:MAG: hypothetical protein H8E55_63065 [Pelagibacterales bacterium]|nr:hypothetical protein [Pelagibacterales bacterium]
MISSKLINRTLNYFDSFSNHNIVVNPSLPILYFGNLTAYEKSNLKIITVGKNPSKNEFKLHKNDVYSFIRFPKWEEKQRNLIESLNPYFEEKPLKNWFASFEPILNGLSASYYGNAKNTALHTDICSPLATDPTWSNLSQNEQNTLSKEGSEIWEQLIDELKPDVMLISIPFSLFRKHFSSKPKELVTFTHKKDGRPRMQEYIVETYKYTLGNKNVTIVFGKAANKPFDTICNERKNIIGERALERIRLKKHT